MTQTEAGKVVSKYQKDKNELIKEKYRRRQIRLMKKGQTTRKMLKVIA